MIALDTNILARAIAAEIDVDAATKAQSKRAQALLSSGRQLFVPVTVIEELEWVLRGGYVMPVVVPYSSSASTYGVHHGSNFERD